MSPRKYEEVRPAELGILRLLTIFAGLSVTLLVLLAIAPAQGYFTEWRAAQKKYNSLAAKAGKKPIDVGLRQIWRPELDGPGYDVVDRCGSCHLAAAGVSAALPPPQGEALFAAHPAMPHDPREFGCAVCHGGQGRATSAEAAHGRVEHWEEPLLPRGGEQAGCGTCHSNLKVASGGPAAAAAEKGGKLYAELKCDACHGAGAAVEKAALALAAPRLTSVGLRGFRGDWHALHVTRAGAAADGSPWSKFTPLADEEVAAIGAWLGTQVGAPRLIAGKTLAHQLGCRGCHKIGGVGGDDGPDLTDEGRKHESDLDFQRPVFTAAPGAATEPRSLLRWLTQHFLDPAAVVPGSKMPRLGVTDEQARLLSLYMLSLRQRDLPEALQPKDRVRGMKLGERDFPTDGESLYGVFCAACHGRAAEGSRYPGWIVPAISDPDFLAIADDNFLRRSIQEGRPGRRMPSWGGGGGGLRPQEIDALVGFLRAREPVAPTFDQVKAAAIDLPKGKALYADQCAPCHGEQGEGSAVAPPLAAADNIATHDDNRIYGTVTVGVAGTAMGSFKLLDAPSLRSLIAAVRALPPAGTRTGWVARSPTPEAAKRGESLYAKSCGRCHGAQGEGGDVKEATPGPALGNRPFLSLASDGYLAATILRGRRSTAMPRFGVAAPDHAKLSTDETADVVAFVRSLAPPAATPPSK